jgi:hypothetical protein
LLNSSTAQMMIAPGNPNPVARPHVRRYGKIMNAHSIKTVWWWAC